MLYRFAPPDKVRRVVPLTRDSALGYLSTATVAPITSSIRGVPSEVKLDEERYEGPVCGQSPQCGNRVVTALGQAGGRSRSSSNEGDMRSPAFFPRLRRRRVSCKCESLRSYRQVGARGPIALMGPTARFWRRSSLKFDTLALRGRCAELRRVFPICFGPCHTPHGRRCQICLPKLHLGRKGTAALTNSGAFAAAGSHGSCHASARHYAAT